MRILPVQEKWMLEFVNLVDRLDELQYQHRNALLDEAEQLFQLEMYQAYFSLSRKMQKEHLKYLREKRKELKALHFQINKTNKDIKEVRRRLTKLKNCRFEELVDLTMTIIDASIDNVINMAKNTKRKLKSKLKMFLFVKHKT